MSGYFDGTTTRLQIVQTQREMMLTYPAKPR